MDVAARRQRAGEHEAASLPSTSTIRFVLLIVLVIVTSASTGSYLSLLNGSLGRLVRGALPCLNDTGIVVGGPVPPAGVLGSESVLRCSAPVSIVMTSSMAILAAAVVGGAYLLYLALPWWRVRRHRLTRLPAGAGPLRPYLDSLVHEVGLSHPPVFLIAPYNRMAAGLAFGRRGRPMIQLNAGLFPLFVTDRATFRAVVLHELGHVKNRDIGKTYFTVAVWRAFLLFVFVPFAILNVFPDLIVGPDRWVFSDLGNGLVRPMKIQSVAAFAAMTALIYLTRAAVLRSREYLADATAAAHGGEALAQILRRAGREPAVGRVAALLRAHPTPAQRLRRLEDPLREYQFDLGEVFASGMAVSSICTSVLFVVEFVVKSLVAPARFEEISVLVVLFIALLHSVLIAVYLSVVYWRVAAGAARGDVRTPAVVATAAVLAAGVLLGEPLSIAGALGGFRLGVFGGVAVKGNLASGTVSALLLIAGVLLLARWIRDSAALRLSRPGRRSLRSAHLGTATIGGLAFLCGFWIWYGFHGTATNGRVDWWTAELARSRGEPYAPFPGIGLVNAQYDPLEYFAFTPFATILLALPWIYVLITALRRAPPVKGGGPDAPPVPPGSPRVRVRLALLTGLCGGLLHVAVATILARPIAAWTQQMPQHYRAAVAPYLLHVHFHLAAVVGALVGGAVVAMAPRLGITLGLAASYVSGTVAAASMPFTLALARCSPPLTLQRLPTCLARAPVGVYPYVFNQIIARSGLAALAAGLLWTAAVSVVRKAASLGGATGRVRPGTADGEPAVSRGDRVVVAVWTAVLSGIVLSATVVNTIDYLSGP